MDEVGGKGKSEDKGKGTGKNDTPRTRQAMIDYNVRVIKEFNEAYARLATQNLHAAVANAVAVSRCSTAGQGAERPEQDPWRSYARITYAGNLFEGKGNGHSNDKVKGKGKSKDKGQSTNSREQQRDSQQDAWRSYVGIQYTSNMYEGNGPDPSPEEAGLQRRCS